MKIIAQDGTNYDAGVFDLKISQSAVRRWILTGRETVTCKVVLLGRFETLDRISQVKRALQTAELRGDDIFKVPAE